VVIASSDLAHYPKFEDALNVDQTTLAAIETGRPAEVRAVIARLMAEGVPNLKTCACGLGPILVTMGVAAGLGADTTTVIQYANSGYSPRGSADKVVGYGAVMLWRYQPLTLTSEQQQTLLQLARRSIADYLQSTAVADIHPVDPILLRRAGAFVTLRSPDQRAVDRLEPPGIPQNVAETNLKLRGCMGHVSADLPLYRVVHNTAISAATADPRLPPVTLEALDDIVIEISIMSPLRRITRTEEIEIGRHGLLISQGERRGLLLPEVAGHAGWDRQTFLEQLCRKAQLPPQAWQAGAALYRFTTLKFKEQK
ncbi:MAG: AmmeMemoRadiSam system protein A, partial [Anaerolineae bacterium]|nr:AmmeMemoRadiSam system protein A [Anaerolineae bacterium]